MKTILTAVAVSTLSLSGAAFAGGHSNAPAAQEMVDAIQAGDPGSASVARELRKGGSLEEATGASDGNRGWGNTGSRVLGENNLQVSKSGKRRNAD